MAKVSMTVILASFLAAAACGEAPPPPPSAVVTVAPEEIPEGRVTPLLFDGAGSTPRLTLVPATPDPEDGELEFRWEFAGGVTDVPADLARPVVQVTATGDRPVHATLTVTNRWGGRVSTLHTVPLVFDEGR